MAADTPADPQRDEPLPCAPCRGTGRVISHLGGSEQDVQCPWCEGGGTAIPGHDAQAQRRDAGGAATDQTASAEGSGSSN